MGAKLRPTLAILERKRRWRALLSVELGSKSDRAFGKGPSEVLQVGSLVDQRHI
jgi:hypothetical protein